MFGAMRIMRIGGIELRIHWTFFLLLFWIAGSRLLAGAGLPAALISVAMVVSVFACVVLHELGHAAAARMYGIGTEDITLLPIGGVARLRSIPEKPTEELVVAVAGPLVNVGIAALLGLGLLAMGQSIWMPNVQWAPTTTIHFVRTLLTINLFLVVFNAIPAFPMDGGRVLRALLALFIDRVRATQVAARVGQILAVGLGLLGLFGNPMLLLIAAFVWFGAASEAAMVRTRSLIGTLPVRAAMIARVATVRNDETIADARNRLLASTQQDFPVLDEYDQPIGMLFREQVINAIRSHQLDTPAGAEATPIEDVAVTPSTPLQEAMAKMQALGVNTLPVLNGENLVGIVTMENVAELLLFREEDPNFQHETATPHAQPKQPRPWI